jgi:hypothetical protein
MHVSQICICPNSFTQQSWCANFIGLNNATFARYWAAYWDFRIPYLLHPMSTTWALSVWPAVYGMYRRNITVDLKADVDQIVGHQLGNFDVLSYFDTFQLIR